MEAVHAKCFFLKSPRNMNIAEVGGTLTNFSLEIYFKFQKVIWPQKGVYHHFPYILQLNYSNKHSKNKIT